MSETPEEQGNCPNCGPKNKGSLLSWLPSLAVMFLIILGLRACLKDEFRTNSDLESAVSPDVRLDMQPLISEKNATGKIALISVLGPIGGPQTEATIAKLRAAASNPDIKAVLLKIDSPGGGSNDSDLIWSEVLKVKVSSKPVVAFFNGIAASAAYHISTPADKIIATPGTWTGSIGVIAIFPNYSGLMQKLGLAMVTIKSGEQKDMFSPFRPTTPEEKAIVQRLVDESFDDFVDAVSKGRKMANSQVRKLADGRIYSAKQAKADGLIDEIGYFEDAVRIAKKLAKVERVEVVEIQEAFNGFNLLNQKFRAGSFLLPPGIYRLNLALYLKYYQN